MDALERIAALGDSAPESTRLCAVLTKGTSALELFSIESSSTHSLSDEGKSSLLSVILTLPKCRQGLQLHTQEADAVNLKRAIERFRRAAVKIFDVIQDKEVKAALDGILELLEYTIREVVI